MPIPRCNIPPTAAYPLDIVGLQCFSYDDHPVIGQMLDHRPEGQHRIGNMLDCLDARYDIELSNRHIWSGEWIVAFSHEPASRHLCRKDAAASTPIEISRERCQRIGEALGNAPVERRCIQGLQP
jgi:hypothetical protein